MASDRARHELLAYNPAEVVDLGEIATRAASQIKGSVRAIEMVQSWASTHGDLGFSCRIEFQPKDRRRRPSTVTGHGESAAQAAENAIERLAYDTDGAR